MRRPSVELISLRIKGYRSCKNTYFNVEKNITALIGKNGAGKTNVLHALQLLKGPSRRRYRKADADSLATSCTLEARFRIYKKTIGLRSKVIVRPGENGNLEEIASARDRWDFREFGIAKPWVSVAQTNFLHTLDQRAGGYVVQEVSGPMVEIGKQFGQTKFEKPSRAVETALRNIKRFRSQFSYYSASQFTNPSLSPTSFEIDEDGDLRNSAVSGEAHVSFLYDLFTLSQRDSDLYFNYTSLVGPHGVNLVNRFVWKKANVSTRTAEVRSGGKLVKRKRERILIIPTVHIGEDQLSFNQLSEGTFRTLAMLFYIMTDNSEFFLLEEPELCVHHGLLTSVLAILNQYSDSKQIVLSTHSEFVLDGLAPENVRLVSRQNRGGTLVKSISHALSTRDYKALKEYLMESGSLGEYWRHSGFEK